MARSRAVYAAASISAFASSKVCWSRRFSSTYTLRFLAISPSTSYGVPLKLSGAHNAAFSSSLFLVGITLTRILSWSIRATVNITVRSPRSGISSMNIRPPCKKLVHSRSVEGAAGSMRRGFTLLFYGACQLDSGEAR